MKNNYNKMYNTSVASIEDLDVNETKVDSLNISDNMLSFVVVDSFKLKVREAPTKSSEVKCIVDKGDELIVKDILDDWLHIIMNDGFEGFVMKEFVKEV